MPSKTSPISATSSTRTDFPLPASPRFAQRFAGSPAARPRLLRPSLDGFPPQHVLDRLQPPLTRFHD